MTGDVLEKVDCHVSGAELRATFTSHIRKSFLVWMDSQEPHFEWQLKFAAGRLEEGIALARYFQAAHPETAGGTQSLHVLDLGAGNGGISVGLANDKRFNVTAVDMMINHDLHVLRRSLSVPLQQISATGAELPLGDGVFDIVLLLETIEHVDRPAELAAEIMRVLKPGGVCMLTTPQRLYYLFRPDPHFGIRFLMLLPDWLQRFYVTKIAARKVLSPEGKRVVYYDVHHIYWTVTELVRLFPDPKRVGVFYMPGADDPSSLKHRLKKFLWDRILVYKGERATSKHL